MDAMSTSKTIPIQAAAPAGGCGHCPHSSGSSSGHSSRSAGADCPVAPASPGAAPQLSGPADELARLLAALARQPGFEAGTSGLVRALRLLPGEVELQLTVGRHCGGAELADTAFQALRGLLPDTDIYVMNAC